MASITAFDVGYCSHPGCMALKGAGLKNRCFPSRAYLIQTSRGLHLWDTGYSEHFMDAAHGIYRLYPLVTPIHLNAQAPIVLQLKRMGIHAADLRNIVVSHFHADHIAGLLDFPGVRIVCAAEGWQSIQGLKGLSALRRAFLPGLVPLDMPERTTFLHELPQMKLPPNLIPFESARDIDGSGEVYLIELPGHAIGHLGAFVHTESGWTLLASDAAWAPENYTELRGPSELSFLVQDNRSNYYDTLRKMQRLHQNGIEILLTHQQASESNSC
jgi:glyoxylase-like metal-dependent hydrolase (beta-lactamase superfamily II)